MKVYCCFSLYNLYIAVAKAMVQNEKIDLVIGSQMPDYKNKIETIKSLDFINDIYVFDSVDYKNIKYKNKTFQIIDQFGYDDYFIFLQFVIYRRRTDKPSCSSCFIRRNE